tara:strand:+ start:633 stop:914 length:282 start_codon:yes stop_codon:yes gene_type:complete
MTMRFFNPDGTYEDKEDTDELKAMYAQDKLDYPVVLMKLLREKRNRLLAETDYLTLSDTTEISDAWKTYRQALRDLPANTSDPENPVWPTKPS